jgi:hypothetical protein
MCELLSERTETARETLLAFVCAHLRDVIDLDAGFLPIDRTESKRVAVHARASPAFVLCLLKTGLPSSRVVLLYNDATPLITYPSSAPPPSTYVSVAST